MQLPWTAWLLVGCVCAWRWRDGFEVAAESVVPGARREAVWRRVHDMGRWAEWHDTFDVAIDGMPKDGKPLRITCRWHDGAVDTANEVITRVEAPSRLCWDYDELPDWLLGTERCIVLSESTSATEGGAPRKTQARGVHVRNYERFWGPLAPLIWIYRGTHIQRGFEAFNRDLGRLFGGTPTR